MDVPLQILDIKPDIDKDGDFVGASLRLKNNWKDGLVSLVMRWSFADGGEAPKQACSGTVNEVWDSWATDGSFLESSAELEDNVSLVVKGREGRTVQNASITILYAEFVTGERFGPGRDSIHALLKTERESILTAYSHLAQAYANGIKLAELSRLIDTTPDPGMNRLKTIRAKDGMDGVLTELLRQRRLQP